jgi:predicted urease superfamily metal-dependent hydrolase
MYATTDSSKSNPTTQTTGNNYTKMTKETCKDFDQLQLQLPVILAIVGAHPCDLAYVSRITSFSCIALSLTFLLSWVLCKIAQPVSKLQSL